MRDIKFKAWNDGSWTYSEPMPDMGFWKWVAYDTNTVFCEYTGLKDKNGVEIYEGDICQDILNKKLRGAIYYQDACFYFGWQTIIYLLCEVNEQLEVIGNIYENPEELDEPIIVRLKEIVDEAQVVSHYDEAIDIAVKKLQALIDQECTKARIAELERTYRVYRRGNHYDQGIRERLAELTSKEKK